MDGLGEFVTTAGVASMCVVIALGMKLAIRAEIDGESDHYAAIVTLAFGVMMLILISGVIQKAIS